MSKKIFSILAIFTFYSFTIAAQVQVNKEPRHKKTIENKYMRVLDVWIKPGDTTLFHIHSTPSLFLHFTNTVVCSQEKGKVWVRGENKEGNASYRSFVNDTLVHRVSNCDTVPFHVTDIEILAPYKSTTQLNPLPFTVLFENEKAFAYRLTSSSFNNKIISNRGPMIAELIAGSEITFHDSLNKKSTTIKAGKYLYINSGTSFYFSATGNEEINLVIFEIK